MAEAIKRSMLFYIAPMLAGALLVWYVMTGYGRIVVLIAYAVAMWILLIFIAGGELYREIMSHDREEQKREPPDGS